MSPQGSSFYVSRDTSPKPRSPLGTNKFIGELQIMQHIEHDLGLHTSENLNPVSAVFACFHSSFPFIPHIHPPCTEEIFTGGEAAHSVLELKGGC